MLSIGPRFIEAVEAVSGNGIPSTSSPGLVVIPAKGFGIPLMTLVIPAKESGKMLSIGPRCTEAVEAV